MKALWGFNVGFGRSTSWVTEWRFTSAPLGVVRLVPVPLAASSWDLDTVSKWHRVKTTKVHTAADVTGWVSLSWAGAAPQFLSSRISGSCDLSSLCAYLIPSALFNRGVPQWHRASALQWDSSVHLSLPMQRAKCHVNLMAASTAVAGTQGVQKSEK